MAGITSKKPIFVIVPGAFHLASAFTPTLELLTKAGYTCKSVDHVSSFDHNIQGFEPDVENIRKLIDSLLDAGEDLVIVMHSYGGVAGAEAVKSIAKEVESETEAGEERKKRGEILRMVWLTAFALPAGTSLMDRVGGKNLPWWNVKGDVVTAGDPNHIFYGDLSGEEAAEFVKELRQHAYRTLSSKVSFEPWKVFLTTYIICENDNAIPVFAQEAMIAGAKASAPQAFDVIERLPASHTPFAKSSQAPKVAEFLIQAAGGN